MAGTCDLEACQREAHENLHLCLYHAQTHTPEDLDKNCTIPRCPRKAETRQMCSKHYQRYLRYVVKDLIPDESKNCDHPQCNEPLYARHLCKNHYQLFRKYMLRGERHKKEPGERCGLLDCNAPAYSKRLCDLHYQRVRRTGTPYLPTRAQRHQLKELNWLYDHEPEMFDVKKITGEIDIDEIPEHVLIYNRNVHGIDLTLDATDVIGL